METKSYIGILHQAGEGCDYTIGCGTKVLYTSALSMKEAFNIFVDHQGWKDWLDEIEYHTENPLRDLEFALDSMTIYEVGVTDKGEMYETFLLELDEQVGVARASREAKRDEAEFKRLKQKLGK